MAALRVLTLLDVETTLATLGRDIIVLDAGHRCC